MVNMTMLQIKLCYCTDPCPLKIFCLFLILLLQTKDIQEASISIILRLFQRNLLPLARDFNVKLRGYSSSRKKHFPKVGKLLLIYIYPSPSGFLYPSPSGWSGNTDFSLPKSHNSSQTKNGKIKTSL